MTMNIAIFIVCCISLFVTGNMWLALIVAARADQMTEKFFLERYERQAIEVEKEAIGWT